MKKGGYQFHHQIFELLKNNENSRIRDIINKKSADADLKILKLKAELLKKQKEELFNGYDNLGNVLFVNSILKKK